MKSTGGKIAFVLFSVALLVYVLKDMALGDLAEQFQKASYGWTLPVAFTLLLMYACRALRWRLVLETLGYRPTLLRTLIALMAGNLTSLVVPGAGELTRCGTLTRTDGIPLAEGIGSVVAERIVDLLALLLLILLTFSLEYARLQTYLYSVIKPRLADLATSGVLWIGLGFFFLTALLIYRTAQTQRANGFVQRVRRLAKGLWTGLLSIRRLKQVPLFIGLTILIYFLAFAATYLAFFAMPQADLLNPRIALTIFTLSTMGGLAVPTQGGLGTYHALARWVLMIYGFGGAEGTVIATFLHAILTGLNGLWSLVGFLAVPFLMNHRRETISENRPVV